MHSLFNPSVNRQRQLIDQFVYLGIADNERWCQQDMFARAAIYCAPVWIADQPCFKGRRLDPGCQFRLGWKRPLV